MKNNECFDGDIWLCSACQNYDYRQFLKIALQVICGFLLERFLFSFD
jgi:hypothetical protein